MQTLEQAALKYANKTEINNSNLSPTERRNISFQAGAEWQKQQVKELINLMRQLLGAYDIRHPNAIQLLAGYTNEEAFDKLNKLLEQFQD